MLLLHGYPEYPSLSHALVSSFGNLLTPGLIERAKIMSIHATTVVTNNLKA